MTHSTTKKIAELNDLCRSAMGVAGRVIQTAGIAALPAADQAVEPKTTKLEKSLNPKSPAGAKT